jgi:hypothetical protein
MLSRVSPIPSVLWRQVPSLALQPNETKLLLLSAPTKLPANSVLSVSLTPETSNTVTNSRPMPDVRPGIVALRFSTVSPAMAALAGKIGVN